MRTQVAFDAGNIHFLVSSDAYLKKELSCLLSGFRCVEEHATQMRINLFSVERLTPATANHPLLDGGVRLLGWSSRRVDIALQSTDRRSLAAGIAFGLVRALLGKRGLLLHASCGIGSERAFVFVGPSGAGKSTILRNARGLRPLHDDRVAVLGPPSALMACCMPQIDNAGRSGSRWSVRLGGIFILHKAEHNWVEKLNPDVAVSVLARQTVLPQAWNAEGARAIVTMWGWIARGLVYRLHFQRQADVTKLVEEVIDE